MRDAQAAAANIDDYIAAFPAEVRERLQSIRRAVRRLAPDAVEKISYQIPTFALHGNLVHFAAFKNHIGLYPGTTAIETFAERAGGLPDVQGRDPVSAGPAAAAAADREDRPFLRRRTNPQRQRQEQPMNTPDDRASLASRLIRNIDDVPREHQVREPLYDTLAARLAVGTVARKLGASIDIVAPGKLSCPYHCHHAQEEMFVILEGSGTLRVAGELLPLRSGDVVFIPPGPEYPHQIINTSDRPLKYLSVSTRETPEIVEYPDSGKFLAQAAGGDARGFDVIQRTGTSLDYWDGEP